MTPKHSEPVRSGPGVTLDVYGPSYEAMRAELKARAAGFFGVDAEDVTLELHNFSARAVTVTDDNVPTRFWARCEIVWVQNPTSEGVEGLNGRSGPGLGMGDDGERVVRPAGPANVAGEPFEWDDEDEEEDGLDEP
jgi:hypothetical protein